MFSLPSFRRQDDRPAARLPQARRPLVEDLEGRKLLSGIIGQHIGMNVVAEIQGAHIGVVSVAAVQGAHVGSAPVAQIIGAHIG